MKNRLFRKEAIEAKQVKWAGDIILTRPISFTFLTIVGFGISICIIIFLIFGSFTKRSTVQGQLIPINGLVKVYALESGIISEKKVSEGQKVEQGDILYIISNVRYAPQGDVQKAIKEQIIIREKSLQDEKNKYNAIHINERDELKSKILSLRNDISKIVDLIKSQEQRIILSQNTLQRYQDLLTQDYISKDQFQQKKEELLDQKSKLQNLEREKISISSQLESFEIKSKVLKNKQTNDLSQLDRQIATTQQELTEIQAKQKIVIRASEAGIATAVSAEVGQQVDTSKPMLSIIPEQTLLIAQLYVPSNAIGFIKQGDNVLLRYQGYPYQKFGHATGTVSSISKTSLSSRELNSIGDLGWANIRNPNDPIYVVKVLLKQQAIEAYGKQQRLQVGMLLEADILQEKRRLYEWALDPLYSITGKL